MTASSRSARAVRLAALGALVAIGVRCASPDTTGPGTGTFAIVADRTTLITGGDTVRFRVIETRADSTKVPFGATWTSGDTSTLVVDSAGLVTSRKVGMTKLYAHAGDQDLFAWVSVLGYPYIRPGEDSVVLGGTKSNILYANDVNGSSIPLSAAWHSVDAAIAPVDGYGTVTGEAVGHAIIWARFGNESVSVLARVAPLLIVTPAADTLLLGDSLALVVHATNANGDPVPTPAPITWTTSNPPIIAMAGSGLVHPLAPGPVLAIAHFDWAVASASLGVTPPLAAVGLANTIGCGLDSAGTGWCWNYATQVVTLGTGSDDSIHNASAPHRIVSAPTMTEIGGGDGTGCGLGVNGRTYCWSDRWPGPGVTAAVAEGPAGPFTHLAVGYTHRCAWNAGGAVGCWTIDQNSNFGQGANPAPHTFTALAAGPYHTCGVEAGAVWCWGDGGSFRLGAPTTDTLCGGNIIYPCSATPLHVNGLPSMKAVSGGAEFTCGIAVDESAWCWGSNEYGQLGSGDPIGFGYEFPPHQVAGGLHFKEISAGYWHACGVTTGGDVYCWGEMWDGLGASVAPYTPCADRYTGSAQRCYPVPALVRGLKVTGVRASHLQECGIRSDRVAMCWSVGRWQ